MHLVIHEYEKGGRIAFEVSDDGGEYLKDLAGQRQVGQRICAYADAACDSTEAGYDRLLDALNWLAEEVKKRKAKAAVPA
jgi:hypothetical protein